MIDRYTTTALAEHADCLLDQVQVAAAIAQTARTINAHYAEQEVVVWTVMNGALVFSGHLLTQLTMPVVVDYVHATRYHKNEATTELKWFAKPVKPIQGKHVLICDDIFDRGLTLSAVRHYALEQGAASVRCAVMAHKLLEPPTTERTPEFCSFTVPDRYVFGMGMDCNGYWRNASGIWALRQQ